MMPDLSELIARVEALEGADREVDALICVSLQYGGPNSDGATSVRLEPDWEGDLVFEVGDEPCCNRAPELTASLDAALALVERVGGDAWFWQVGHDEDDPAWFRARILPFPRRVVEAEGPTPALAVVHALLRALAMKEKDRGE